MKYSWNNTVCAFPHLLFCVRNACACAWERERERAVSLSSSGTCGTSNDLYLKLYLYHSINNMDSFRIQSFFLPAELVPQLCSTSMCFRTVLVKHKENLTIQLTYCLFCSRIFQILHSINFATKYASLLNKDIHQSHTKLSNARCND